MGPKENTNWVPAPVYRYIPYSTALFPIKFPQSQQDIDLDSYDNSEEYLGYLLYDDYIDCYMWPELIPFNTFDYVNELQILESENIFGNLFGNPILDMEDFILEVPITGRFHLGSSHSWRWKYIWEFIWWLYSWGWKLGWGFGIGK